MSASLGPKLFTLTRDELEEMMVKHRDSVAGCVAELTEAVESEENAILRDHLGKWLALLARDLDESTFQMEHLAATPEHSLTGTELIGIARNWREVEINIAQLRMAPPPTQGELAERRQAATIAAVPRASVPDFLVGARGR